jgi:PPOX class probable F420-dependent enzyme
MATSATLDQLPAWAHTLLEEARVGHLGLLDGDGRPRVLPVTYAVLGGVAWSAVDHKPKQVAGEDLARVRWLRERPQSALTVDRYDDDWARLAWVQLTGTTHVVDAGGEPTAVEALAGRYPQYRDRPPAGPLLRLTVERAVCWSASEADG